ncbi:MAG: hypothetical protein HND47_20410 [Chloroflexi bacterium]|nr:hypothetical protein [Chloroflexota bacterium]
MSSNKKWTPLVDEISASRLGSIHGLKKGSAKKAPHPSVLIATHMDAIGLMVYRIVDGFLYITNIGGIDPRVLPGRRSSSTPAEAGKTFMA